MSGSNLELLQGTLDVLVLKALIFGPEHGYAVARWIRETTDGALEYWGSQCPVPPARRRCGEAGPGLTKAARAGQGEAGDLTIDTPSRSPLIVNCDHGLAKRRTRRESTSRRRAS